MKFTISILVCVVLLLVNPCKAAQDQALSIQQERLQDIYDVAFSERQDVENWYLTGLDQLKQQALRQARRIKPVDRILWTEFILKNSEKLYGDSYFSYNAGTFLTDPKAFKLRAAMMESYFLNTAADFLIDADARKLLADIVNSDILDNENYLIRTKAQELLTVMDYFAGLSESLENQRAEKLSDLQIWEENSKADVIREMGTSPKAAPFGTVNAVMYDKKGSVCMIEGIDKIIKPGDMIKIAQTKSVKVVKIDINKVQFDANSRQWVQIVGQSPNAAWK